MSEIEMKEKLVQERIDFIEKELASAVPEKFRVEFVNDWIKKFENDGFTFNEACVKLDEYLENMSRWDQKPDANIDNDYYKSLVKQPLDEKIAYIDEHMEYLKEKNIMLPENRLPFVIDFLYASEKTNQPWARYEIDGELIAEGVRESCNFADARKGGIGGSTARQTFAESYFGGPTDLFRNIQGHALYSEMAFNKELIQSFFRGHSNEPQAEKKYRLQTGIARDNELDQKIIDWHTNGGSDKYPWLKGNPDFIGRDPEGNVVLADFKSSADPKKSKKSVEEIPDDYYAQLAYYCLIIEREVGIKVDRIQLVNYNAKTTYVEIGDVNIPESFKDELLVNCDKFWKENILANVAPEKTVLTKAPMVHKDLSIGLKEKLKKGHALKQAGKILTDEGNALISEGKSDAIESGLDLMGSKKQVLEGAATVISHRETKKDDIKEIESHAVRALSRSNEIDEVKETISNSNINYLKELALKALIEIDGLESEEAKEKVDSMVLTKVSASILIDKYSQEGQDIVLNSKRIASQAIKDIEDIYAFDAEDREMDELLGNDSSDKTNSSFYKRKLMDNELSEEKSPF